MQYVITLIAIGWLLMAPRSLLSEEEAICDRCMDGPEMFQHVKPKPSPVTSITSVECASPITKTYGRANRLVTECGDGRLMISARPRNRSLASWIIAEREGGYSLVGEHPRDAGRPHTMNSSCYARSKLRHSCEKFVHRGMTRAELYR